MTSIQNDKIKISGAIGMVYLQKNDKNIYVFYDDHSNDKYCSHKDSTFLYDFMENILDKSDDYIVLLEEPFVNNYSHIKFLWNETPHIIKFRNFYKKITKQCSDTKICMAFPIDVRLILTNISIDEILLNINNAEYFIGYEDNVEEYFKFMLYLFNYDISEEQINGCDKNLFFVKEVFNKFNTSEYYIRLKNAFELLYSSFIKPNLKMKICDFIRANNNNSYEFMQGFPFENFTSNSNFLNLYDSIINGIMEFYTFILITGLNKKNIIIYSGYYHSNNISYLLEKYYNYKKIYAIGNIEDIENISQNKIVNCLYIDKKIFNT